MNPRADRFCRAARRCTLSAFAAFSPHRAMPPDSARPTIPELFLGFLTLGLTAFGGALPLARREIVERRKWLDAEAFTDLLGLCQFLPGGNVINLSVAVGMRFRGVPGAIAGLLGLLVGPSLIVIGLGVIYQRTHQDPRVAHLFAGLAAAAAGLLIAMAVKLLWPLRKKPEAAAVALVMFAGIALLRTPLLPSMLVLTPISVLIAWKVRR